MKTLYIDCQMGAAGDMLSGALLELMPDKDAALAELNALGIPGVEFARETLSKCGIAATHLSVRVHAARRKALTTITTNTGTITTTSTIRLRTSSRSSGNSRLAKSLRPTSQRSTRRSPRRNRARTDDPWAKSTSMKSALSTRSRTSRRSAT